MNIDSNDVERLLTNHENRLGARSKVRDIFVNLRKDLRLLVTDGVCQRCSYIRGSQECQNECGSNDSTGRTKVPSDILHDGRVAHSSETVTIDRRRKENFCSRCKDWFKPPHRPETI